MRRTDKEITNPADVTDILKRARICHVALCADDTPYVVPMNYGYDGSCLYLHSAREGRKIDIIRSNNLAAFSVYLDEQPVKGETACTFNTRYRSVMGEGRIKLIDDAGEKEKALRIIMQQQADAGNYTFERASLDKMVILRLDIEKMSGKKSGYPG